MVLDKVNYDSKVFELLEMESQNNPTPSNGI